MTDSIERKPEDVAAAVAKLDKYNRRQPADFIEPKDLPRWVKTAMAYKEVLGYSWKEAAQVCGKSPSTLDNYKASPAAQKWRESLRSAADDPTELAKAIIAGHQTGFTIEYLLVLQEVIAAKDHDLAEKMLSKLMTTGGVLSTERKSSHAPSTIQIVLPTGVKLEPLMVETEHKALTDGTVKEAEYEIE